MKLLYFNPKEYKILMRKILAEINGSWNQIENYYNFWNIETILGIKAIIDALYESSLYLKRQKSGCSLSQDFLNEKLRIKTENLIKRLLLSNNNQKREEKKIGLEKYI